jgi:hypothetical protein
MGANKLVQAAVLGLMLLAGWTAGRAQTSSPDFELVVTTTTTDKGLDTSVECVKGCKLAWVQRGVNPRAARLSSFEFSCSGNNGNSVTQCPSGVVGGWIQK